MLKCNTGLFLWSIKDGRWFRKQKFSRTNFEKVFFFLIFCFALKSTPRKFHDDTPLFEKVFRCVGGPLRVPHGILGTSSSNGIVLKLQYVVSNVETSVHTKFQVNWWKGVLCILKQKILWWSLWWNLSNSLFSTSKEAL